MSEEGPTPPEFRKWSLENFGQALKISGDLEPEVFPYRVSIDKDSQFFRSVYDGVYRGQGVTVHGSERGNESPLTQGVFVEHHAVLAANDIGEVMVSRQIFQGDQFQSLTYHSQRKLQEYNRITRNLPLPPGWRRFGYIHSHPAADVINSAALSFARVPKVGEVGVTWSGGDFESLVSPIAEGHTQDTVLGVITPVQLGFMIATERTIEVLQKEDREVSKLITATRAGLPPYRSFEELGLVMYAGNHRGRGENFTLERLIY